MQVRDAAELRRRAKEPHWHAAKDNPFDQQRTYTSAGETLMRGVGTIQQRIGDTIVFRFNDEPGAWRWQGTMELVAPDKLHALFGGDPMLEREMAERQAQTDRERALEVLHAVIHGAPVKEIERRGSYALVESGGLFDVVSNGAKLLPSPAAEAIARSVFDALTAAPVAQEYPAPVEFRI